MSPAIKIAGRKSTGKSSTKPAAKRSTGSTRKPASTNGRRKRNSGGTVMSDGRVRRDVTDDQKVIQRFAKRLAAAGDERDELYRAHKEAVQEVFEISREAMEAGVPTGVIAENARISRQWLYKMGEHADRGENGNGAAKPKRNSAANRARKTASAPTSRRKSGTQRSQSKSSTRKGGAKKLTIRSR